MRYVVLLALCCVVGVCIAMLQFPYMPILVACVVGVGFAVDWWCYVGPPLRAWDESDSLFHDFPASKEKGKAICREQEPGRPPPH